MYQVEHKTLAEESLSAGFKYSHFRGLIEKGEVEMSDGRLHGVGGASVAPNMKNMDCSCKFKRVFVKMSHVSRSKLSHFEETVHSHHEIHVSGKGQKDD